MQVHGVDAELQQHLPKEKYDEVRRILFGAETPPLPVTDEARGIAGPAPVTL
eukprot:gene11394-17504_t